MCVCVCVKVSRAHSSAVRVVHGHLSLLLCGEGPVPHHEAAWAGDREQGLHWDTGRDLPTHSLQLLQELHTVLYKGGGMRGDGERERGERRERREGGVRGDGESEGRWRE